MTKSELRTAFLERRRRLSNDERASQSRHVAERFFEAVNIEAVKTLHTFIPIRKFCEIDTSHIYERIWIEYPRVKTVVARVNFATGELEHANFTAASALSENKWGIREPINGEQVNEAKIDLVLVPLLAFDRRGYRVGYGRGFYDKFLSRCCRDCLKVGLSYFPPVEAIGDADAHDVPLDQCITPQTVFSFTN